MLVWNRNSLLPSPDSLRGALMSSRRRLAGFTMFSEARPAWAKYVSCVSGAALPAIKLYAWVASK